MVTSRGSVFDCDGVLGTICCRKTGLVLKFGRDYTIVECNGSSVVINIKEFRRDCETTIVTLAFFFIDDYSHTETLVAKVSHLTPQM